MSRELLAAVAVRAGAFATFQGLPLISAGVLHIARDSFARAVTHELYAADLNALGWRTLEAVGPGVVGILVLGVIAVLAVGLVPPVSTSARRRSRRTLPGSTRSRPRHVLLDLQASKAPLRAFGHLPPKDRSGSSPNRSSSPGQHPLKNRSTPDTGGRYGL